MPALANRLVLEAALPAVGLPCTQAGTSFVSGFCVDTVVAIAEAVHESAYKPALSPSIGRHRFLNEANVEVPEGRLNHPRHRKVDGHQFFG